MSLPPSERPAAASSASHQTSGPTDLVPLQSAGRPERRGIELISDQERHGRARALFGVWAAPNVSVLNLTVGATLPLVLGLELWQSIIVVILANALWILPGIVATSGPAAGTSGSVITRAIYGVFGNKVIIAFYGWFVSGLFLALNWVASTFMGSQWLNRLGVGSPELNKVVVTLVVSGATVLVAIYGHGLILRAYTLVAVVLAVVFVAVTVALLPRIDFAFAQAEPLTGVPLWASLSVAFAIIASTPLSYSNSADMSRYLRRGTPPRHVVAATTLGGALPSIVFVSVGVLLGSAIGPEGIDLGIDVALLDMLPGWLVPLLVLGIVVNTVALNAMTTYSASLVFQSIGLPIKRIPSAVVIGVLGTALTLWMSASSTLLSSVNLILQLVLIISVPAMTVYAVDVLVRRNRYSTHDLFDERRGSAYWYSSGFGVPGLCATVLGGVATALCLSTDLGSGPVTQVLGGIDLSVPVGMLVTGVSYLFLGLPVIRRQVSAPVPLPASR